MLKTEPLPSTMNPPKHVAFILDGNGRWAKSHGKPRFMGHVAGIKTLKSLIDPVIASGVEYVTLYAFSSENWKRPFWEIKGLIFLFLLQLKRETKVLIEKKIRLKIIGDLNKFPAVLAKGLRKAEEATAHFEGKTLLVALNYGSRDETLEAIKNYTQAVQSGKESLNELTWEKFTQYLYTKDIPDPDLIIRTSGEHRLSNFLLLQSAYSEFYFTPVYWPDFTPEEYQKAIDWYIQRNRRFGKIQEQIEVAQSDIEQLLKPVPAS